MKNNVYLTDREDLVFSSIKQGKKLSDLAKKYKVSPSRVRQIFTKSLRKHIKFANLLDNHILNIDFGYNTSFIRYVLFANEIEYLSDLSQLLEKQVKNWYGVGPVLLKELKETMIKYNIEFKEELMNDNPQS